MQDDIGQAAGHAVTKERVVVDHDDSHRVLRWRYGLGALVLRPFGGSSMKDDRRERAVRHGAGGVRGAKGAPHLVCGAEAALGILLERPEHEGVQRLWYLWPLGAQ